MPEPGWGFQNSVVSSEKARQCVCVGIVQAGRGMPGIYSELEDHRRGRQDGPEAISEACSP